MNNSFHSDGTIYKSAALAIFLVLGVLIVMISVTPSQSETTYTPSTSVTTTTKPVETVAKPVETTAKPVDTTAKPVDTTAKPVETTAKPVDTTAKSGDSVQTPVGYTSDEIAAYLAKYPNTVLPETSDAGQEYIDKLIFLGDSTTYGLRPYKMLSGGKNTLQVWTPTNGTITLSQVNSVLIYYPDTDKEMTIKDAVQAKQPEYIVITLGVNGVSFMNETYFKKEYSKLIESIQEASPNTKIICQSIFPVAKSYELLKSINNEKIDVANRWICELADECGVKYVDTNSALRGEDGWLPEEYHNGDGMHLQTNSFTIELNNLRTHAWID